MPRDKKETYSDRMIQNAFDDLAAMGEENKRMLEELEKQKKILADAKQSLQGYKGRMDSAYERLQEEQTKTHSSRERLKGGLTGSFAFFFIFLSLFFLSNRITGNAISDLSTQTNSLIGIVLLIVGLIAGFFWIKENKE